MNEVLCVNCENTAEYVHHYPKSGIASSHLCKVHKCGRCLSINEKSMSENEKSMFKIEAIIRSYSQALILNLRDAGFALASEEAKRIMELVLEDVSKIARGKR